MPSPRLALLALLLSACTSGAPAPVALTAPSVPVVTPTTARPAPTPAPPLERGADISWPSCPVGTPHTLPKKPGKGEPLPEPDAQFVVIGLTNGPGFYPNPCLSWEVSVARSRHLAIAAYAFTTLPNAGQISRYGRRGPYGNRTPLGRVRNAAYAEAQLNVASLRRVGLKTPIVWLDVEPQPYLEPWGSDIVVNRAVIYAAVAAYRQAGYATGFYSSDLPWKTITGGLQDPSPVWVSAGPRGEAAARAMCGAPTWSGGLPVLAQYWPDDHRDVDLTCLPATAARFFSR